MQRTYLDQQAAELINLDEFHNQENFKHIDGTGETIVILDSGVNAQHSLLTDKIIYSHDFGDDDSDASDRSGHGTHVTSIIAAGTDNTNLGVAPGAQVVVLKVFRDSGLGTFGMVENALRWIIDHSDANPFATGAELYDFTAINLSLSDRQLWQDSAARYGIDDELDYLANNLNIIPVASAGNQYVIHSQKEGVSYPAADPNTIPVGAVYDDNIGRSLGNYGTAYSTAPDRITPYSQRSSNPNIRQIFAPGARIKGAAKQGNGTAEYQGTSQAAPYVTGAIAIAQQLAKETLKRELNYNEIKEVLYSTGVDIIDGDDEDDNVFNTGHTFKRLDILAMGKAIAAMAKPSQPVLPEANFISNRTRIRYEKVNLKVGVQLSAPSDELISVDYSLMQHSAIARKQGIEYFSGTLEFLPGQIERSLIIPLSEDIVINRKEVFKLRLSNPVNSVIGSDNIYKAALLGSDFNSA